MEMTDELALQMQEWDLNETKMIDARKTYYGELLNIQDDDPEERDLRISIIIDNADAISEATAIILE